VKTIFVDGARVLKRMRPAPQGRGYRVRKRSNHVTIAVDVKGAQAQVAATEVKGETSTAKAPKSKGQAAAKKTTKKAKSENE